MAGQGQTRRLRPATSGFVLVLLAIWILAGGFVDLAPGAGAPTATTAGKRKLAARVERRLLRCTNDRRERNGLKPLRVARALKRAARFQAKNMARLGFFGHIDHRGRGPGERVALFKPRLRFTMVAENIAAGQRTAASACSAWMTSGVHRKSMLGHWNRIGVGFWKGGTYGRYYVQEFARVR
jgi:uncharacterized protein YkwD